MISWSIRAANESDLFDRIIVSTDDKEIADIAIANGADVPFIRPDELSDDHTGTVPVVAHATDWQNSNGDLASEVCCIYATAPFLHWKDLVKGYEILSATEADYAFSVTEYAFPIQRALRILANDRLEMFDSTKFESRSQDLETGWHDAGQFYWGKSSAWLEGKPLMGPWSAPVILPRTRVQDIDTTEDWKFAELMFKARTHVQ